MSEEHNHNQTTTEHTYVFEHKDDTQEEKGSGSKFLKAFIILVILVVLFFISIGIVRFVPKAINSVSSASVYLSSIFGNDKITLLSDVSKVKSGSTVNFSWKNGTEETGFYTWSFKCTEGVTILYRSIDGSMQPVICETKFPIPESMSSYPFVFNSNLSSSVKINTTITLWDKETKTEKGSGSKTITILPKGSTEVVETENTKEENTSTYSPGANVVTTTSPTNTAQTTSSPANTNQQTTSTQNNTTRPATQTAQTVGANDISLSLIQANGLQNGSQNVIPLTNISQNDRVMIRFRVTNNGTQATGPWKLRGVLPTLVLADRNFTSQIQPSLSSGESHEMTMMFDSYDNAINQIVISADNSNDTNQTNNILRIPISGSGSNNNNNSNLGGLPDLTVKINSIGLLNRNTNQFLYTNAYGVNDRIAVKFDVENLGGQSTGYWNMKIEIPTSNGTYQTYGPLSPIAPGQKASFTIGFDNPTGGNQNIIITADYNNQISEYNNNNNSASQSIYVNNYQY